MAAEIMTPAVPLDALLIKQQLTETTLAAGSLRRAGDQGALSKACRHQKGRVYEVKSAVLLLMLSTKEELYLLHMQCPTHSIDGVMERKVKGVTLRGHLQQAVQAGIL